MSYDYIMTLTEREIWKLTDCFNERLVAEIVAKQRTNKGQLDAINHLIAIRKSALIVLGKPRTSAPQYFDDWRFDIKTGVLVEGAPRVINEVVLNIQTKKSNETPDVSENKPPIAELEAELEKTKAENAKLLKQLKECQSQPKASEVQEAGNDELVEELEGLREQVEHFRNKEKGTALGLNQAQAALFGLALANTFHFKYTNKKEELSPMLHKLFGWGQAKLKTCLSTPCDKAERNELANLFKDLCPPLYESIMNWGKLPQEVTP